MTTTRAPPPASSRATARFDPFTLSTSSAPASTAVRISFSSKLSTLTRIPAPRSSLTTAPSEGNGSPGVQPMSITSAPLERKYSAAARTSSRERRGALLISARISTVYAP